MKFLAQMFSLALLLFVWTNSPAQNIEADSNIEIIDPVEEQTSFPGGLDSLIKFIESNLILPDTVIKYHMNVVVYTTFIVETDGSLSAFKIRRGIGWGMDKEAIRVLKLIPKWEPAHLSGKAIRAQMFLPIRFNTDDSICESTKPQFPGGQDSLLAFVSRNINYGRLKREEIKHDYVPLMILINEQGDIVGSSIFSSFYNQSGGGCEEEALRIISKMPRWIPAKCNGISIPSSTKVQIRFIGK